MNLVDLLMLFAIFVAQPIHGAWDYRRYLARIEAGAPPDRVGLYLDVLKLEWGAFAVLFAVWIAYRRPFSDLGFVAPAGSAFLVGLLVLGLGTAYLLFAWRAASRAEASEREKMVASLGKLVHFSPNSVPTYRWFVLVSVTAGIVEEVVYRGFVFWCLAFYLPAWAVVLLSSLAFGLGHSYQGANGMARVTLVGIVFGTLYELTGSIWLPILAHAILDILQGATLFELLRKRVAQPA